MLFGELVRDADLGIQVVVAAKGASERPVRAAVITDVPDPSAIVTPDAIVLTTAMWSLGEGAAGRFVDAVAGAGGAAIVIGLAAVETVPDGVVERCRERQLTLATAGPEIDLGLLAHRVADAQDGSPSARLALDGAFRASLARTADVGEAIDTFASSSRPGSEGGAVWLMATDGEVLGAAGARPSTAEVGALWNALQHDAAEAAESATRRIHPVDGRSGERLALVVVDGPVAGAADSSAVADDRMVALLEILGERLTAKAERTAEQRRWVGELVRAVAAGSANDGEVSARLRLLGVDPESPLVVASGSVDDATFAAEATLRILRESVEATGVSSAGAIIDSAALVIARHDGDGAFAVDRESALPFVADRRLRVGVSDPFRSVRSLGDAVAASTVRRRAVTGDGAILIADRSSAQTHRELLAQFSVPIRADYAHSVLDPLVEYDAKNGGDLLATLRLFLDNNGAWVETARMLDLHPNTMRYRMSRVEDLTRRDLTRMADRVDLFLALACLDL